MAAYVSLSINPPQQAQQARQEAEAALKEYGKDRPQLDTRLRKLNSEKAKLEQDLKHRDHKMDAMQADLDRSDLVHSSLGALQS